MMKWLIAICVVTASGVAAAYPQFQLSRDQTCTGCHLSPAGGSLLNENGLNTAEAISQWGTDPRPFYGKWNPPSWLTIGGDFRAAAGYFRTGSDPTNSPNSDPTLSPPDAAAITVFPMQADVYVNVALGHFNLRVTGGARPAQWITGDGTPPVYDQFWSREHYIEYQSNPGENEGLYVRVGRFMPVFGLRFAEHVDYTREYGGVPLYGETYGASVSYVKAKYEAHLSGFIDDPVIDNATHQNGGAAYAEYRIDEHTQIGPEVMATTNDDVFKLRFGGTAKKYLPGPDLLFQLEVQGVTERIKNDGGRGAPAQLVGYLMATKFVTQAVMIDLGLGTYDEDLRIQGLDRDAIDLNVHWFLTSHIELLLQNRLSRTALFTSGGTTGGWSMLQAHYRL